MEVIVAVAIVAIMAGALAPVIYKQINSARTKATVDELELIEAGLLSFYKDTGRFPTEAEGLAALVTDPGVSNWQGPYVSSSKKNPVDAVRDDAFGRDYVYDLNPTTVPAGAADLLLASGGANLGTDAGRLGQPWDLSADTDDVLAVVNSAAIDRDKENDAQVELEYVAEGCRGYFQDNAAFPAALADLAGDYVDAGYENDALVDPWEVDYQLIEYGGGGTAPTLRVYSYGPDRTDDAGADDDLSVLVSSVPPGRHTSQFELSIAQAALNANPGLVLAGAWAGPAGIRGQLGLTDVFDLDGWGNSYQVNVGSRVIYSIGPDGNAGATADNIPTGVGP